MKGKLRPRRINAKLQYDVELMVQQQVVMIFIANYKEMIRYLPFSTFAYFLPMKGTIVMIYTREGFMQKPQMIWNLPIHIVQCVVMIFIANYKEMIRYLLFSTFV